MVNHASHAKNFPKVAQNRHDEPASGAEGVDLSCRSASDCTVLPGEDPLGRDDEKRSASSSSVSRETSTELGVAGKCGSGGGGAGGSGANKVHQDVAGEPCPVNVVDVEDIISELAEAL